MPGIRGLLSRYRLLALAVLLSAAAHAAIIVSTPGTARELAEDASMAYTASLIGDSALVAETAASAPAAKPKVGPPRPRVKRVVPPRHKPEEMVATAAPTPPRVEPAPPPPPEAPLDPELASSPVPEEEAPPKPELLALASPTAPREAPSFDTQALPGSIKITYALNSAVADGRAVYEWEREGDGYVITGEAEAVGFIASMFLEGRILQETRGKVTAKGLRPSRFTEQRPGARLEGLEFDWYAHKVTFERGDEKRTTELKDNTLDWLSMIFQLAHQPPKGDSFGLAVFTQRRLYQFTLKVLGEEEIDIPIGKVRTLHMRHANDAEKEYVDVWLGIDHHFVPVKMRYPAARNRIMVDQTATRISER